MDFGLCGMFFFFKSSVSVDHLSFVPLSSAWRGKMSCTDPDCTSTERAQSPPPPPPPPILCESTVSSIFS